MEALGLGRLDDQERSSLRAARRIGRRDDDDQICELAVADESLLPIDDALIAVQLRRSLDPLQVRSRAGFGLRDGADEFARGHLRQLFPLPPRETPFARSRDRIGDDTSFSILHF